MLVVRDAVDAGLAEITAIYRHHVLHGVASFEIDPPDVSEMPRRWHGVVAADLPYLVAGQAGLVIGHAYVGPYRMRPAYRNSVENSVYVDKDHHGLGAGSALMAELIKRCRVAGRHQRFSFRHVGTLTDVGFKHDRWLDSVLMQLDLSEG